MMSRAPVVYVVTQRIQKRTLKDLCNSKHFLPWKCLFVDIYSLHACCYEPQWLESAERLLRILWTAGTLLKHAMVLSLVPFIALRLLLPVKLEFRIRRS